MASMNQATADELPNRVGKLERPSHDPRDVQHMFRTSVKEHNLLIREMRQLGYTNLSAFFRHKLGLGK